MESQILNFSKYMILECAMLEMEKLGDCAQEESEQLKGMMLKLLRTIPKEELEYINNMLGTSR